MQPPRGGTTETESACAGGSRARRAIAALLACLAGAGLVLAATQASGPRTQPATLAASTPTHVVTAPMIVVPTRTVHVTKATIGLFTATPARLSAAGGSVRLLAIVQDAKTCRFSFAQRRAALSTKTCASGSASVTVKVPKNTSGSPRAFHFELKATGARSSTSAGPVTVIEGASQPPASKAPVVSVQPGNETVAAGATASFTAAAHGTPSPTVRWQVSADGGGTWSYVSGATANTLSFTTTASESGGEYRAVFTNTAGSAHTSAATLTVSGSTSTVGSGSSSSLPSASTAPGGPISLSGPGTGGGTGGGTASAPQITQNPANLSVASGQAAAFTAAASGATSVKWQQYNGVQWVDISGASSTTLSFIADLTNNGAEFRAVFTNAAGSTTTAAATLTVTQSGVAPTVTENPNSTTAEVGTEVTLAAGATGTPAPTIQWYQSSSPGSWTPISGANSTTYDFVAEVSENGYEYRAVFTNSAGTATSASATLTIAPTAPVITQQPSSQTATAGSSVTFNANATGVPTPTVQWWVSTNGGSTWGEANPGGTSISYTITATDAENGFEYEAVFTNSQGTATTNAATLVIGSAGSTSSNWSGYAETGAPGSFTSAAGSWTVPTVSCAADPGSYSSDWVGIDGDAINSTTVEQDGTDSDCDGTQPSYYAWYEMYGDQAVSHGNSVDLPNPVSAGDTMSAGVSVSGSSWTLSISDETAGWSQTIPITFSGAAKATAEWIVERPQVNGGIATLADFGGVGFSGATANGSPISSASSIAMYSGSDLLASPGPLGGDDESFVVTWYASS